MINPLYSNIMASANELKKLIKNKLGSRRLFYVCRDAERAEAGLLTGLRNFVIVTNASPYSAIIRKKYPNQIIEIKSDKILDTLDLLKNGVTKKMIKQNDFLMVFKPTVQIEAVCREMNWQCINPPAALANLAEEKLTQFEWLGNLSKFLPNTKILLLKDVNWSGKKFIVQFNRAHTGSGTVLIESPKQLKDLQKLFPMREARIAHYISGPVITSNNIVLGNQILLGNISYQITGLPPFTDNRFATIGNDWALPEKILSKKSRYQYNKIVNAIGKKLAKDGWAGLFGIDAVVDEHGGRVYLIEINARQPASTCFESVLQDENRHEGEFTVFEAHLLSLINCSVKNAKIVKINNGSQIVQRITAAMPQLDEPSIFKPVNFRYILYNNTKPESDLLRVQTRHSVMEKHGELNEHGNELSIFIRSGKVKRIFNAPRAGMILVKKNHILLLERNRYGYHYWAVPGGTVEKGEEIRKTASREILEETGLSVNIDNKIKPIIINASRHETYFWAKDFKGKPMLGGPERERNSKENHYKLKWLKLSELKKVNLLPKQLKSELLKRI